MAVGLTDFRELGAGVGWCEPVGRGLGEAVLWPAGLLVRLLAARLVDALRDPTAGLDDVGVGFGTGLLITQV